jgi:hypothetical protein
MRITAHVFGLLAVMLAFFGGWAVGTEGVKGATIITAIAVIIIVIHAIRISYNAGQIDGYR